MKPLKILFILALSIIILPGFADKDKSKHKAKKVVENCCGRCTGSSSCRVCSNCSRCAHCNSGGSCGVCRTSTRTYKEPSTYTPTKTYENNSSQPASIETTIETSMKFVKATQLNIREQPSTTAKIVGVLYQSDIVSVIQTLETGWLKIKTSNGLEGYVMAKYLQ